MSERTKEWMAGEPSNKVLLPRWVIYAQASLLGMVGIVAFVFGLMVGQVTTSSDREVTAQECNVSGIVLKELPTTEGDAEAVVLFLPVDVAVHARLDPEPIAPLSFRPLQNPVIDQISAWRGAVVRTDAQGRFATPLDAGRRYWMVVISKHVARGEPLRLSRAEMAAMARFFLPVEALFRDRAFKIQMVAPRGEAFEAPEIRW